MIASERAIVFLFLLFSRDNTHRCTLCPCHSTPFLSFSFSISLPCCFPPHLVTFPLCIVSFVTHSIGQFPLRYLPSTHTPTYYLYILVIVNYLSGNERMDASMNSLDPIQFSLLHLIYLKHPTSHSAFIPSCCVYFHSWFGSNGLDFYLLSFLLPFSKQGRKKLLGRFRRSCC